MAPTGTPDDTLGHAASPSEHRLAGGPDRLAGESRRPLRLALPADPVAPSVARHRIRRWLAAWAWPTVQLEDVVLAVSEAVSNATEHAYVHESTGLINVRGGIETTPEGQRRVTIVVRDHGCWRPPPANTENRRHGIPLMRACMDSVTIGNPGDGREGTRVVLRSKVVPASSQPTTD